MKRLLAFTSLMFAGVCLAAPDACYVRTDAAAAPETGASAARSFVGLRRKTDQLFELDISVAGPDDVSCSLAGVAKLRGEPGQEALAMTVRPDPTRKTGRSGTLCQVFVQLTPTAIELRTTPGSCQAQSLCEGKVELNGQRFEHATKLPTGTKGPCFERRAP